MRPRPAPAASPDQYEAPDDTTLALTYVPNVTDPLYNIAVFGPKAGPQPEHLFKDMAPADCDGR